MKRFIKTLVIRLLYFTRAFNLVDKMIKQAQHKKYLRFYSQFIQEGDLCFDIGANIGDRTLIFSELGARVIAIEPQSTCVKALKKRINGNRSIVTLWKAVGDKKGYIGLKVNTEANCLSSCSPEWIEVVKGTKRFTQNQWDRTITVPITTLDDLIDNYGIPSFIKIDVEGFEHTVLKGLSQSVRAVSFEYTPGYISSAKDCIDRLTTLGVTRFNYSIGEDMKFKLPEWVDGLEMYRILAKLPDTALAGDVYAKIA